ncbi:MAG: metal-sensitive transcriptional regulator [SAR202 cluster bacterium]|nr:metal-sensitive transcriptional regulator [SAR202 cluster bacterium]
MRETKAEALKRLNYLSGHLDGVRRMVEADTYCVDVLKQTHAIRRGIEKLEALLLEGHLRTCLVDGVREGREHHLIDELMDLYSVSKR